jgi:hypothetical protein
MQMTDQSVAIKGLMLTPPILGRIAIGHMETKEGGKRVPVRDNHFSITSQAKRLGEWIPHPLQEELLAKKKGKDEANAKLTSIPVTLMFNDPALNMRAELTAFHKDGRPLCVGDGQSGRRVNRNEGTIEEVRCVPSACEFGKANNCKAYGRLNVQIEGQEDELGTFILRTTGINTIRSVATRMEYLKGVSNNKLAGMPLSLVLRGKSTSQSHGSPVFYVDLTVREGMKLHEAVKVATEFQKAWEDAGLKRDAFEESARQGMLAGLFEDSPEDTESILEEFFNMNVEAEQPPSMVDVTAVSGVMGNLDQLRETLDSVNITEQPKQNPVGEEDPFANGQTDLLETVVETVS